MSHAALRKTRHAQPETIPSWGVFIIESHHEEGFEMETRVHDFMKIFSVVGGAGRIHLSGKPVPMTEGDAVIVPPGTPNRVEDEPGKPMSLYVLCVAPHIWQADPNLLARLGSGRLALRQAARQRLGALMRRLLFEQSRSSADGALPMVSLALQTILLLLEAPRRPERIGLREIVEEYAEELERTFYESDHLDAVAERLGMSRRRFTQLFREVSGKTWLEAVRDLRLAHAQHLLRETNRTVASIAFECGFADLSSFYRAFSRQEGVSPLKWRETQRPS